MRVREPRHDGVLRNLLQATPSWLAKKKKEEKMKSTWKTFAASAATALTFASVVVTAPSAHADDYCITNGAQSAHGCGYPTMEACQAASAGIGGSCSQSASSANTNPDNAMAQQTAHPHLRHKHHKKKPIEQ
ncbi:MAG TPA: DUF3551 domain-containing protein [Bradyrhizobium sp.]|nr:DUF3551 domain-containing protein [Bradyrhizobium sp.]